MRNVVLVLGMAIVLFFSLTLALAQDETKSPAQLCKELGWGDTPVFDACVLCAAQSPVGDPDLSTTPVCICKTMAYFEPDWYSEFKNQGECIKYVRENGAPF